MDLFVKVFLVISVLKHIQTAPRQPRLSLAEYVPGYYYYDNNINGSPHVYSFGYDVSDPVTGNTQYRSEERHPNGTVTGSYGYIDPYGMPQKYRYIADSLGYRVYSDVTTTRPLVNPLFGSISTESSVTWTRPPRKNKKKVDMVSPVGTLFTQTNLI